MSIVDSVIKVMKALPPGTSRPDAVAHIAQVVGMTENKTRGYYNHVVNKRMIAGFVPGPRHASSGASVPRVRLPEVEVETDEQVEARIAERFDILEDLARAATEGDCRALIVSGPAGLGKSYTVEEVLKSWDPDSSKSSIVKGYVRATGLYKLLYAHRHESRVLVFDDADSIFFDDVSLNFLKAVCDTTERRRVSYLAETDLVCDVSGDLIPRSFQFDGTIIFITNYNFDAMIEKGHKLAPHMLALMSRAHYVDLAMHTRRDYVIRIGQVVRQGLLSNLTKTERDDVVGFILKHQDDLREVSLRTAMKIGALRHRHPGSWSRTARVTTCKN